MRIYRIDQLIEKRVDETGTPRQEIMKQLMALLSCSRQKLFTMRTATKGGVYSMNLNDAQKLKQFFGLEKIDDLTNPAADRVYKKQYGKKQAV